jgi:L-seryl-tRNA(Ser) seleniumtransferase
MTLAALEATLRLYLDEDEAKKKIPTLRMILEKPENIKKRASKIVRLLRKSNVKATIKEDISMPGGGSLPEVGVKTFVVAIKPHFGVDEFVRILREAEPAVVARIKEDEVIFDARTIQEDEIPLLVNIVKEVYHNDYKRGV